MKLSYLAAGALTIALFLWMASGLIAPKEDQQTATEAAIAEPATSAEPVPMKVEFIDVALTPKSRDIVLQGQLNALRSLNIRTQTGSTVDSIHVKKGQRVSAGDIILTLSLDGRNTDLREARAKVKSAKSEQQAAASLSQRGLQSQVQLEQTSAQLESARAQLDRIQRDINNTRILAPFAGVINALPVEIGQLVDRGAVVAELIDDSQLLVSAQAAQQSITHLSKDQAVSVKLITGEELQGTLSFISAVADSNSRSFKVEATVDNPNHLYSAGISASLIAPVEQIEAMFITPSALSLGDDGELGVKIANQQNVVEFLPITLVSTSLEGAWVTGIPDKSRVITLGHAFVSPGQEVDPVPAQTSALTPEAS